MLLPGLLLHMFHHFSCLHHWYFLLAMDSLGCPSQHLAFHWPFVLHALHIENLWAVSHTLFICFGAVVMWFGISLCWWANIFSNVSLCFNVLGVVVGLNWTTLTMTLSALPLCDVCCSSLHSIEHFAGCYHFLCYLHSWEFEQLHVQFHIWVLEGMYQALFYFKFYWSPMDLNPAIRTACHIHFMRSAGDFRLYISRCHPDQIHVFTHWCLNEVFVQTMQGINLISFLYFLYPHLCI